MLSNYNQKYSPSLSLQPQFQEKEVKNRVVSTHYQNLTQLFINNMLGEIAQHQFLGEFQREGYTINRSYINGDDEFTRLYHARYTPPNPVRTIVICHGYGEHCLRHLMEVEILVKHGCEVLHVDQVGFGYSGGPRGFTSIEEIENNMLKMLSLARQDLPAFLIGYSMGGLVTSKLLLERPQLQLTGCILFGPLLNFPGDRHISEGQKFLGEHFGAIFQDILINSKVNPSDLSKNDYHIKVTVEDKHVSPNIKQISIKTGTSMLSSIDFVQKNKHQFRYPLIVFHGKEDTTTLWRDSQKFVNANPQPWKKLHLLEHGLHELHQGVDITEIYERILQFFEEIPPEKRIPLGKVDYQAIKIRTKSSKKSSFSFKKTAIIFTILGILLYILRKVKK